MADAAVTPRLAQQIRIRPAGDGFAFASIVAAGWSITGIRVKADDDGSCVIEWPHRETDRGERFPIATPAPEIRDQLEQEITDGYRQALARRRAR
jgi:hypothetical protein